jgi:hypothetical protein
VTLPEGVKEVTFMIRAAKNGQWSLFAGFLILLLIFGANKLGLKDKVGSKALPWICVTLGVLSSIGVMLSTGIAVDEAIAAGFMAGLSATGGWELIFKHMFKGGGSSEPEPVTAMAATPAPEAPVAAPEASDPAPTAVDPAAVDPAPAA